MRRRKYKRKTKKCKPEMELEHFRVRGNFLEANITNVLPEIWPKILQYLSSSDFVSLINSSPLISKQLKDEKETRLLPIVLPILVTRRFDINDPTFLKLRKVHPATKQAINTLPEKENSPEKYWETITTQNLEWSERVGDGNLKLRRICQKVMQEYCYRFQKKVQRYLEHEAELNATDATNFNPFLARYLHVLFDGSLLRTPGESERFLSFMTIYGQCISHLKCSNLKNIHLVFSLLPLLPNLKVLKLYTKEDVQSKDEYVRQVHYPDLPHLEFLDIEGFYDHETDQINTRLNVAFVKKYGPQIKALNCNNQFFRGWWGLGSFYCKQLCNLQRLRVATVGDQALAALSEANLPTLQEIHFAESTDPFLDITLQQVIDAVNRFSQNLTCFEFYVRISTVRCRVETLKEGTMIPFPNLTKFSTYVSNVHFDWFWPFIQHKCPNLEELKLQGNILTANEKENHKMIQRTAFQLAPKLKRITLTYVNHWHPYNADRVVITRSNIHYRRLRCQDEPTT